MFARIGDQEKISLSEHRLAGIARVLALGIGRYAGIAGDVFGAGASVHDVRRADTGDYFSAVHFALSGDFCGITDFTGFAHLHHVQDIVRAAEIEVGVVAETGEILFHGSILFACTVGDGNNNHRHSQQ